MRRGFGRERALGVRRSAAARATAISHRTYLLRLAWASTAGRATPARVSEEDVEDEDKKIEAKVARPALPLYCRLPIRVATVPLTLTHADWRHGRPSLLRPFIPVRLERTRARCCAPRSPQSPPFPHTTTASTSYPLPTILMALNTVAFPSASARSSADVTSLLSLSAHHQTAAEICELFYGASPPAWQSIERYYDPNATYENPFVTATSKDTIGDVHALSRTLGSLDVPKPGAVLCTLFRLSADHKWRDAWFRGVRMWNEINDISECESFGEHPVAVCPPFTSMPTRRPQTHDGRAHTAYTLPSRIAPKYTNNNTWARRTFLIRLSYLAGRANRTPRLVSLPIFLLPALSVSSQASHNNPPLIQRRW